MSLRIADEDSRATRRDSAAIAIQEPAEYRRAMYRWTGPLVALITLVAGAAHAQDRAAARQEFEEASRQYEQGHYALALRGFERAYELMRADPRGPLILYNIGRAQEALGRFAEALRSFERYLAEAPADAPYRDSTVDLVRDLRARVAASSDGIPDAAATVRTSAGGGLGTLDVLGLTLGATGVLAALVAIPTGVVALEGGARLERECSNAMVCAPTLQPVIDETRTMALVTDVLWITGVAIAALGITLFAIARATESPVSAAALCTQVGCVGGLHAAF